MNNISTLKTTKSKCESPKTPGGISKSLLTPCRRVGLSRKWRNAGPSPFVSPLTTENSPKPEVVVEKRPARKKSRVINPDLDDESTSKTSQSDPKTCDEENCNERGLVSSLPIAATEMVATPTRSVQIPRKSKSKASIKDISSVERKPKEIPLETTVNTAAKSPINPPVKENSNTIDLSEDVENNEDFTSKPVRNKSVREPTCLPKKYNETKEQNIKVTDEVAIERCFENETVSVPKKSNSKLATKHKSPNNLTKECMVLIQKKINKNVLKSQNIELPTDNKTSDSAKNTRNTVSQALFDSDSDEAPLSTITKKHGNEHGQMEAKKHGNEHGQMKAKKHGNEHGLIEAKKHGNEHGQMEAKKRPRDILEDDDEDFHENIKVKKLQEKNTSTTDLKIKINKKTLQIYQKPATKKVTTQALVHVDKASSQDSYGDDDEDFDFDSKRTIILIRKTYEKTTKPQKAKSTGSITERDIEDLKNRIEMKKNQLLAKTMTQDTEELRNLIRRWKKGCQDALVELMDLMKLKFPEKSMDYSEILRMLKIPAGLVGYDSDNDTFVSPDDASTILSKFNV